MAMAGKTGGVQVDGLADVESFGVGDDARSAPEGGSLRGFHLKSWTCDVDKCQDWSKLGLRVVVDGDSRPLPDTQGSYVVAVPAGAVAVDLVMKADGVSQSLSLLTGAPGPDNIAVLARADRDAEIGAEFRLTETNSTPVQYDDGGVRTSTERRVTIEGAHLRYYVGNMKPKSPRWAFLVSDASFTWPFLPDARYRFTTQEIAFRADDGREYELVELSEKVEGVTAVFEVPADTPGGKFLLGGKGEYPGPPPYTVTLSTKPVPFTFS
jgi:hypothetical protein